MTPDSLRGKPRCPAIMVRSGEQCARHEGHTSHHRTGYAADNQYRRDSGHDRDRRTPAVAKR